MTANLEAIKTQTDAAGRRLDIVTLEEANGAEHRSDICCCSYIDFYIANGGMYKLIHEHFERGFNAVSCRLTAGGSALKVVQASVRQGETAREGGMYKLIHEHFERGFNAVSCRLKDFQLATGWWQPLRK